MILRNLLLAIVLMVWGTSSGYAQQNFGDRQAEVSLISERDTVQAGETFFVAFDLEIAPKWHVYWRNAGDSGLPAEIFWADDATPDVGDCLLYTSPSPRDRG